MIHTLPIAMYSLYVNNLANKCKICYSGGIQFYYFVTTIQGCTTCMQPSQGCVHLAKDNHKVVWALQRIIQACHKLVTCTYYIFVST